MPSSGQLLLLIAVGVALVIGVRLALLLHRGPLPGRRGEGQSEQPMSGTNLTFGEWGDGKTITWSAGKTTKVVRAVRRVPRPPGQGEPPAAAEMPLTPGEVDFDHPAVQEMLGRLQGSLRPVAVTTDPAEAERYNRVFSEAGISFSVEAEERGGAYEARVMVAEEDLPRAKALIGPDAGKAESDEL